MIKRTRQHTYQILTKRPERMSQVMAMIWAGSVPLPHIWCGVTAENQEWADKRIPFLLKTPAAVRFVSVEPMLGAVDLINAGGILNGAYPGLDWVIIGCESGPKRRPMELEWARDLMGQCKFAGVAVFVKALDIDGRASHDPDEWPVDLRIREYPNAIQRP